MNIKFVAGFDTIVIDVGESRSFYKELLGVPIPQETIEFDAEDAAGVVSEMKSKGAEILQDIIKGRTVGTDDCVPLVSRGTAYRNNVDSLATQLAIYANLLR